MKIRTILFLITLLTTISTSSQNINGIFVDFTKTKKVKELIQKGDENYLPAYKALIKNADKALATGPFSVMNKKRTPPGGDKHDYMSMGPYWWPDPTKPDGLPYIRKDGQRNPETGSEYLDRQEKSKFCDNVEILGWAYYFSGNEQYAQKALELLEAWFIDPATRMNPNLNFAQGIPGRTDGRGIGIIDWAGINQLISPIQILEAGGILKGEPRDEIYKWFGDYLNWLETSKNGTDEDRAFNNHGTWYDVQTVGIELLLGQKDKAKARLEQVKPRRIATQIKPDGSQPFELARTKSLGYSTMNLRAYTNLAIMGSKNGVDLWNFETKDGESILKAYQFLLPYAQGKERWNRQQIVSLEEALETLKMDFLMAASETGNAEYRRVAESMKQPHDKLEFLLYPLF